VVLQWLYSPRAVGTTLSRYMRSTKCLLVIHAFIMHTSSVVILNQRCWQSLDGQHGKGVDGLFEKLSFQTAFEVVESG